MADAGEPMGEAVDPRRQVRNKPSVSSLARWAKSLGDAAALVRQALSLDWSALRLRAACVHVIAVALCLGGGLALGSPQVGMAAATGALSTGFGAIQRLSNIPGLPMLLAACGMGICAFLGVLSAHSVILSALAGGLIGAACGLAALCGQPSWWFTLQWSVAFLVATAMPAGLEGAAQRGALVLGGGLLQLVVILVSWRLLPNSADGNLGAPPVRRAHAWRRELRYALVTGLMVAAAVLIERGSGLANGYWAPMTALIILRPRRRDTVTRTIQRIVGTLAGCSAATLIAALARPGGVALSLIVIGLAGCAYALQRVNYAAFSFGVTATVVFLLALTGLPELEVAWRRMVATLVGAILAVIVGAFIGEGARPAGG